MTSRYRLLISVLISFSPACHLVEVEAFRPSQSTTSPMATATGAVGSSRIKEGPRVDTAIQVAKRFKDFDHVLETYREETVLIYFGNSKCGPCHLMKKELLTVKEKMKDDLLQLKVFSIDTEKWPQLGARFEVAKLPCLVVFQNGEVKLRLDGLHSADMVVEQVRTLI